MSNIAISIHGGAGTITKAHLTSEKEQQYRNALTVATMRGYQVLREGGTALDAVQAAVEAMEDNPLFNAGCGSVFTHEGRHEMDASIMDGETLRAGAVACVQGVRNPIKLARLVMDFSENVIMCGKGAEDFARMHKVTFEDENYFFDQHRYEQWQAIKNSDQAMLDHAEPTKFGTVGAVALDEQGSIAAATSTGGMTNKRYMRIGDTPVIGAGTYADNNTCAVSCTGHGEYFIRSVAAYDVACLMEYKGLTLHFACHEVINNKMKLMGGEGGLIAVDVRGNVEMVFNTEGMYRASMKAGGDLHVAIYK